MTFLSETEGLWLLGIFGFAMITLVILRTQIEEHTKGFLAADHDLPAWRAGLSLAISWAL